jgi:hypothetical protein
MDHIARTDRSHQPAEATAWQALVWRAAATLVADGPDAIALGERDADERLAILGAAMALVRARRRRRPGARRRAA